MSIAPQAYSYIRLSTEHQLKGHGRQRQLQQSADYAEKHGLQLATDRQLEDTGISAFKGANVKEGALGEFLKAVETGLIPKGSYLLVESLDRVSRQAILESLSLFLRIIQAGIILVTLQDEHVYRADHPDLFSDLIISLTIMSRAHEESLTKSRRVGAAWANKRAKATSHPLTKWCPAWLALNKARTHFEVIPKRAAIIRSIFDEAASGIGIFRISRRLNQKAIPLMGKSKGWYPSYIAKILSNRAVIGEYQPCKLINGKRTPAGEPIANYYPAVIDSELFYRVQQSKADRRINGRGRKGPYLTNLFSGFVICAYCHSPMFFENKGSGPKGGTFFVCDAAKRGLKCDSTRWRYPEFEASFLAFVDHIDLARLVNEDSSQRRLLDNTIQAKRGELDARREESERAYQLYMRAPDIEIAERRLRELQEKTRDLERQLAAAEAERARLDATNNELYRSRDEIKDLIARLQTPGEDDLYKLRSEVSARIKGLITRLEIAAAGYAPKVARVVQSSSDGVHWMPIDQEERAKEVKAFRELPYFIVRFKNGDTLKIVTKKGSPFSFQKFLRTETGETSSARSEEYTDLPF